MSLNYPTSVKCFQISVGLFACLLLGSLTGCGGSADPFSYVKVNGKVSYDDGTPIPADALKLIFIAENPPTVDAKTFARPASCAPKADGSFDVVTSHTYDDGLLPGKHKVTVRAFDKADKPMPGLIPPEYNDPAKTPIEVDTASLPFAIKVKKPAK
jgi:hypothetical protein